MSDTQKDQAPIDFSHPSIGGRKVGHWVPVKQGKEIDSSSIPGVRCIMPPPSRVESEHPTAKPEEKDDGVHTD